MKIKQQELLSIYGGTCLFAPIGRAIARIVRAFHIRYLMKILFVD